MTKDKRILKGEVREGEPRVAFKVKLNECDWTPVFDPEHPSPAIGKQGIGLPSGQFIIQERDVLGRTYARPIRWTELAKLVGHTEREVQVIMDAQWPTEEMILELRKQPPKEIFQAVFLALFVTQ